MWVVGESGGREVRATDAAHFPTPRPPHTQSNHVIHVRRSHPALLRRAAAIVRQRGDVLDAGDFEPAVLELDDRLLAAGAGALDLNLDLDHAVLARLGRGALGGAAGGERGALAGSLEAHRAG